VVTFNRACPVNNRSLCQMPCAQAGGNACGVGLQDASSVVKLEKTAE
jgi:hypothetical protein